MFLPQQPPACNEESVQAGEKSLSEQQALTSLSIACKCLKWGEVVRNLTMTIVCEWIQISYLGDHLLIAADFYFFFFPVELTFEAGSACAELVPTWRQLTRISAGASLGSCPWESAVQLRDPHPPRQPGKTPLAGMHSAARLFRATQLRLIHRKQYFCLSIGLFKVKFSFWLMSLHNGWEHLSS